jgi:L-ascorbate metabolism protein UlaG (beta-lactamase superfamily)
MNINWYGQTCFRIVSQKNRNGFVNLLINPLSKESGLRLPKLEADILLLDSGYQEKTKIDAEAKFSICGPGEYDVKGVYIQGIPAQTRLAKEKTIIYTIESEEIRICHLGRLGQEELSSEQIEKIGEIDILMLPVGGDETIGAKEAVKIMTQIEPKIIIPMSYHLPKLKKKLDGLEVFLKTLGVKPLQPLAKLSIKKKDISKEEAKIIVLEA